MSLAVGQAHGGPGPRPGLTVPTLERSRAPDAPRGGRLRPQLVARAADGLLDLLVVAFAAWTAIYHLCTVLEVEARWAALAGALAVLPAAWAVWRPERAPGPARPRAAPGPPRRPRALPVATLVAALAGAGLFAADVASWRVTWASWILAAALGVAWSAQRVARAEPAGDDEALRGAVAWLEPAVVAAWALGLAVFSLFLLAPDADDSYYVHVSAWVAEHGRFPVRDVLFSDHVFPALYFPPVPSYEALVGTLARISGVQTLDVEYLAVPAATSVLSVLALWRLLRVWRVPMPAVALSVTLVFLLFAAAENRMLGGYFVSRLWQGKVILLAVLVPTLLALLHAYAERPAARRLALLACATVAGVGLSTTAIFVLPVIVTAGLATLAVRSPGRALAGWLAAIAYPAGAAVVTLALHGRQPEVYRESDVAAGDLVELALGTGTIGFVAMLAVLGGPPLLRSAVAAQAVAAMALAVGFLYAPGVPLAIFQLTDLGRVLWRLSWAVPVAALVGALATSLVPAGRPLLLRVVPAAAITAAVAASGVPLWSQAAGADIASGPTWKRDPSQVAAAQAILARARPGDLILTRDRLAQTLAVMSASVYTVSPRPFFVRALADVPAMRAADRARLRNLVVGRWRPRSARGPAARTVQAALRRTGVDVACVHPRERIVRGLFEGAGFGAPFRAAGRVCLRADAAA